MSTDTPSEIGDWVRTLREEQSIEASTLSGLVGFGRDRLADVESGEDLPTFEELDRLSTALGADLVGFDPDLHDSPKSRPQITTILKSQTDSIPTKYLRPIVETAELAHDVVQLEQWREKPSRFQQIRERFRDIHPPEEAPDWQEGKQFAERVREKIALAGKPIESMYGLCEEMGIAVIETSLQIQLSAMALADEYYGPTIILNLNERNERLLPRRFTLAHEVCHIIFDRYSMSELRRFDRVVGVFEEQAKDSQERRADAFAIHLLCPEEPFEEAWRESRDMEGADAWRVRHLMEQFGVSFTATKSHLANLGIIDKARMRKITPPDIETPRHFRKAERKQATTRGAAFHVLEPERQGQLAEQAILAFDEGVIGRSKAIEALGIDGPTFDDHIEDWIDRVTGSRP
jgi:Zn-dependent peptidase ImmA (M78 family)